MIGWRETVPAGNCPLDDDTVVPANACAGFPVAGGEIFLSADVAQALAVTAPRHEHSLRSLSDREFEILRLVAEGHTLQDIAGRLSLAYKTIANYQSIIKHKLGVYTSAQLVRFAAENGLLDDK